MRSRHHAFANIARFKFMTFFGDQSIDRIGLPQQPSFFKRRLDGTVRSETFGDVWPRQGLFCQPFGPFG